MSTTSNRLLKQCKMKFRNCYKLNDGVPNISVFVDKFMGRIQIGKFSVDGLSHLAGQLMMLSVVGAGLGACMGIIDGRGLGEIIPFYLMSFLGLYLYFSVSGLVDLEGKKEMLKVSLMDYLENHMAPRLAVLELSELAAEGKVPGESAVLPERRQRVTEGRGRRVPEGKLQEAGRRVSPAEKSTEEQVFARNQEQELEELLKEFFA